MSRCPKCYRREDATHRALGRCPGIEPAAPKRSRSGYVAPSRRGRPTWAEYNAGRASTPEQKREKARLRQQRRRARMAGSVIHYHGGPITPESCALRVWRGRHAFISWAVPYQIEFAASVCQSFALDNGAFTAWKQEKDGGDPPHWPDYYAWCAKWLRHPACDWAVIPDVIGGTEEENDALIAEWPHGHQGVPVWHLNESTDRLCRLASSWPRVALGSAAEYDVKRPSKAVDRLRDVLPAISDDGVPRVKLHGLRMLNPEIVVHIPLASADSTNVAQNLGIDKAWHGRYAPATKETRADVLVERVEQAQAPHRFSNIVQPEFTLEAI